MCFEHVPWNALRVTLRTVVIDDNAAFISAARSILDGSEFAIVGSATSAEEGLRVVEEMRPEVVLLDIDLGEDSGFSLAPRLRRGEHGAMLKLILISAHPEAEFADLIAESRSLGFVAKSELSVRSLTRLIDAG